MIRRGQVFARAQDESGKWITADVLDLDAESFRAFVVGTLLRCGMLASIKDEYAGEMVPMLAKGLAKEEPAG